MSQAALAGGDSFQDPWLSELSARIWSKPEFSMVPIDIVCRPIVAKSGPRGWLNIHPSLLPRHRGPEPIYWTISSGDREAGISIHLTTERTDAGPILAQRRGEVRGGGRG